MRDEGEEGSAAHKPKVSATKSIRFATIVATGGKPEVYLPLFDPMRDHGFVQAAKQHRVLSIRQEPTSKKADFGIVGYDERKQNTYLVFSKSLRRFADARVVGINYDLVGESAVTVSDVPVSRAHLKSKPSRAKTPSLSSARRRSPSARPARPAKPERLEKPQPRPKQFQVIVRVTTVTEKIVSVTALTQKDAREKAEILASGEGREVKAISANERRKA